MRKAFSPSNLGGAEEPQPQRKESKRQSHNVTFRLRVECIPVRAAWEILEFFTLIT
jgi:hypothetical protein